MKRMWSRQELLAWLLGAISTGQVPTGTKLYKHTITGSVTDSETPIHIKNIKIELITSDSSAYTGEAILTKIAQKPMYGYYQEDEVGSVNFFYDSNSESFRFNTTEISTHNPDVSYSFSDSVDKL